MESRKDMGIVARFKRTAPLNMCSMNRHLESDPIVSGRYKRFKIRDHRINFVKKWHNCLVKYKKNEDKKRFKIIKKLKDIYIPLLKPDLYIR